MNKEEKNQTEEIPFRNFQWFRRLLTEQKAWKGTRSKEEGQMRGLKHCIIPSDEIHTKSQAQKFHR